MDQQETMTDAEVLDRLRSHGFELDDDRLQVWLRGVAAAPAADGAEDGRLDVFPVKQEPALAAALRNGLSRIAVPEPGAPGDRRNRFAALRAEMRGRNLDGVLVPRADAHQGEAAPACAQRLAWLTGFTGSAGLAAVLRGTAALFVDGRYTLQARAEVAPDLIGIRHLVDEPLGSWLREGLPDGGRIGYDPWLHTVEGIERLRRDLEDAKIDLIPVEDNLVDAIWLDRPPPPLAPVFEHPLRFAGRTSREKRQDLAEWLRTHRADAHVLTQPDAIAWLLNVRGGDVPFSPVSHGFALCFADGSVHWFVDERKLSAELRASVEHGDGVRCLSPERFVDALDRLAAARARVSLDPQSCAARVLDRLNGGGGRPIRRSDPVMHAKARKNQVEVSGALTAHRRDGLALTRFLCWLDGRARDSGDGARAHGVTQTETALSERAAAAQLLAFRAADPLFRGPSFETIAAAGPNAAVVHYRVTPESDRALRPGDLFLVDSGGQYPDGTTDVTRTIAYGSVPSATDRRYYTLVLNAHSALATTRFPKGTSGSQLDAIARRGLWAHGLDYDHGTGHGVGSYLSVHEGPQRISKIPTSVALEPGMILSNEPGYYRSGAFGIRLENLVLVEPCDGLGEDGREMLCFRTLTVAPFDRSLIDPEVLAPEARLWLNRYHEQVYAALAPAFEERDRLWLEAATRPIGPPQPAETGSQPVGAANFVGPA